MDRDLDRKLKEFTVPEMAVAPDDGKKSKRKKRRAKGEAPETVVVEVEVPEVVIPATRQEEYERAMGRLSQKTRPESAAFGNIDVTKIKGATPPKKPFAPLNQQKQETVSAEERATEKPTPVKSRRTPYHDIYTDNESRLSFMVTGEPLQNTIEDKADNKKTDKPRAQKDNLAQKGQDNQVEAAATDQPIEVRVFNVSELVPFAWKCPLKMPPKPSKAYKKIILDQRERDETLPAISEET